MRKKSIHHKTVKKSNSRVVLLFDTDRDYRRGVLRGISNYVNLHRSWNVHLSCSLKVSDIIKLVKHWKPDGLICEVTPSKDLENLNLLDIPVIAMGAPRLKSKKIHPIIPNHFDIGLTAAAYYIEKKFKYYDNKKKKKIPGFHRIGF